MKGWSNVRRFIRMFRVVTRHAALHVMGRRLARWPNLANRVCGPPLSGPDRFKKLIEEIGGTFIKFGQMLALQSDLLPLEYCKVLFTLFDNVAAFSYEEVEQTFREDLKRSPAEIFDSFDVHPIATGSIGQVHVAMMGSHKVAVKVRRPSIASDFTADVAAMKTMVRIVKVFRIRALYWIIAPTEEFVAWTQEELDFRREAHYMEELGRNARENSAEKVPAVFWSCTTARILTAEFLEGMTVSEYLRRQEAGQQLEVSSDFDSKTFGGNLIDNFLGDAFRHGMFHADLHPGNLMIMAGNTVGYIDFGISGVLSRYSRRHLIAMTLAYARGDLDAMCEAFFRITTRDHKASLQGFRHGLKEISSGWYGIHPGQRRLRKSITSIMLDLLVLSRENGIWPQRDVIKYIRSAIALDGLMKTFSPGLDIGRRLEMACERHLRWDSVRSLTSTETLAGWFGGYTNLIRDGALRAFSLLRRMGNEDPSREQIFITNMKKSGRKRWSHALQFAWIAVCAALLLSTVRPIFEGRSIHLELTVAVICFSFIVSRVLKREAIG